jgi:L-lactate dehydrogenase complex protein LldG
MSEAKPAGDQNGVLDDVRRALGRTETSAPLPLGPFVEASVQTDAAELVARFTEEATAVRAKVYLMSGNLQFVGQTAALVAEICRSVSATEVALSDSGLISEMELQKQLAGQGFSVFVPAAASSEHDQVVARLAECGVGLTAADYAIAETGTIVLSSDEQNALLVSLLPPVHIALLRSSQIAASLDEVIGRIGRERIGRVDPGRSVTLITGPSRTSDVELVLSIGVHGPKELHVIIVD